MHHPDKLRAQLGDDAEKIAAATSQFVQIQSAYETLAGPDQSGLSDAAAEYTRRADGAEGELVELIGIVTGTRRHGRHLCFAYVEEQGRRGHPPRQIMFKSEVFDHACTAKEGALCTAFPAAKRDIAVGDSISATAVWRALPGKTGLSLCASSWARQRPDGAPPLARGDTAAGTKRSSEIRGGRSATAGWVRCPLCGSSTNKMFMRGAGLRQHLQRKHAAQHTSENTAARGEDGLSEWYAQQAAAADAAGISPRRCAGVGGGEGSHVSAASGPNGGASAAAAAVAATTAPDQHSSRAHGMSFAQNTQLALEEPGSAGPNLAGGHPALIAARDGDYETLRALVFNVRGEQEEEEAAANGAPPPWKGLFDRSSLDRHGASALDWAAGAGHLSCVELLAPLAHGLRACRRDGRGPLHWAARHGRTVVLRYLLTLPRPGIGDANQRANEHWP